MRFFKKDLEALLYLKGDNSLLDSHISGIHIYAQDDSVMVDVSFVMRESSAFKLVTLKFIECTEYYMSYTSDLTFYIVESLKFTQEKDGTFYISLDPYDAQELPSEEDGDVIIANSIELYIPT